MINTHLGLFESLSLLGLLLLLLCPVGATLLRSSTAPATLMVAVVLMVTQVLLSLMVVTVLEAV